MSFHLLGWLCLIAGLLLLRTDLQRGYDVFIEFCKFKENFTKSTLLAQLQWNQIEVPLMSLPMATWTQVMSNVGDELIKMGDAIVSCIPFPAGGVRKAQTKAPTFAKEKEKEYEEVGVTDAHGDESHPKLTEADTSHYAEISVDINGKPTLFRYEAGSPSGSPLALATGYCKVCGICDLTHLMNRNIQSSRANY